MERIVVLQENEKEKEELKEAMSKHSLGTSNQNSRMKSLTVKGRTESRVPSGTIPYEGILSTGTTQKFSQSKLEKKLKTNRL